MQSRKDGNVGIQSLDTDHNLKFHSQLINDVWTYYMLSQHMGRFTLSERQLFLWIFIQTFILGRLIYALT